MTVALDWADQIRLQMGPLSAALQEPGVYEVVVNRPGELWVETRAGWRKDVVRYAPQLASFYNALGMPVNLRGLTFTDVKIGNEIHDGVPVLVVEGTIVNNVSTAVDVPRLRFALRNATGAEVYSWTAVPTQPVLQPGEALPFRSRLASPPAEGHDIQVRFFTRRDAVAGLR